MGKQKPKITPSSDLSLTKTEARLLRGLEAQQELLQRQLHEVQLEGDEVLADIEKRLGLGEGAFARREYGLDVPQRQVVPMPRLEPSDEVDDDPGDTST